MDLTDLMAQARAVAVPVCMSILCGFIIGIERQIRGKPAGIRTSVLICLASYLFVHLGIVHLGAMGDATRVVGQIIAGIGFLGAGVILSKDGLILGVTSAAVIWVLAAVGSAIGFGHYALALVISLVTVAVLVGVEQIEKHATIFRRGVHRHLPEQEN